MLFRLFVFHCLCCYDCLRFGLLFAGFAGRVRCVTCVMCVFYDGSCELGFTSCILVV